MTAKIVCDIIMGAQSTGYKTLGLKTIPNDGDTLWCLKALIRGDVFDGIVCDRSNGNGRRIQ